MPKSAVSADSSPAAPRRQLSLADTTAIIVGIVIGSTIYESSPLIAQQVPGIAWLVAVWVLGGVLALVGAMCYAELANAYPTAGGDYIYLTRAMGRHVGFVFAWVQFWIVRPGSIGSFAYVFADYANRLCPLGGRGAQIIYAVSAIAVLSGIHLLGVRHGKWTQNLLTAVKFLGLGAVVVMGLLPLHSALPAAAAAPPAPPLELSKLAFAMIFIFYAYSGWNEMAYVSAEVRDPARNILRAMILGTVAVGAMYLGVQLAVVQSLGFDGLRTSHAVAADVAQRGLGEWSGRLISVLICISALGGIHGMLFTGARIYYAMGHDHRLFAWLGHWSAAFDTPARPLAIQALVTIGLAVAFGLRDEGFAHSVIFTSPPFWGFLLLVGIALFVLRLREPAQPRPFRVPLYPLLPLVFCVSSGFMFWQSLIFAWSMQATWLMGSLGVVLLGLVLSVLGRKSAPQNPTCDGDSPDYS